MEELLRAHVARFNEGVRTGDFAPMLAHFADDAQLVFVGVPAGPYNGIDAIRRAYRDQPPDDEIEVLQVTEDVDDVACTFAWSRGGTGTMRVTPLGGRILRIVVAFG
jgi:ketosteroid isomerase-like protein